MKSAELAGERIFGVGQERQNSTSSSDRLAGHAQLVGTGIGLDVVGRFLDGDDAPIYPNEPGEVGADHVRAVEALVVAWRGQRGVDIPGGTVAREGGRLLWQAVARG